VPLRPHRRFVARVRAAVGSDAPALRQSFVATLISSGGDLLAGLTLASITHTLEILPGLLVLVPAAIGMRGNVFGALGSRLGTTIHTGEFSLTRRRDTVVGQNVLASVVLTLSISLALAVLAKGMTSLFGINSISIADFVVISIVGGILSSIVVLVLTIVVAALAVRRDFDLDNVAGPLVTAAGDMVTLPALFLATLIVHHDGVTAVVATLATVLAIASLVAAWRARLPVMRRILRESLPILIVAGTIDLLAGQILESRLDDMFSRYEALLVLVPPFLEDTGALGAILSARTATKLHLGIIEPMARPQRAARDDFAIIGLLAVPVFTLVAISADIASVITDKTSPGVLPMVGVALVGGLIATTAAIFIGYYASVATYRLGLDPDNYGVPLITSSMDLVGVIALILGALAMRVI